MTSVRQNGDRPGHGRAYVARPGSTGIDDMIGGKARCAPRPGTVLVVEDDGMVALMIQDALEEAGYRSCGAAATEREALKLAEEEQPAFAVVDLALDGGSRGLDVGRDLTRRGVAVLYASAYGVGFRQEMEDSGGRACLQKPFAPGDVPAALRVIERLGRGERPDRVPENFHLFVD